MPDPRPNRLAGVFTAVARLIAATACLALLPAASLAQGERWFRVELMVFKHLPGDRTESFAATPELAYPESFRFLVDPDQVAGNRAAQEGSDVITTNGRQIFEAPTMPGADTAVTAQPPAQDLPPALPAAFLLSPASAGELRGKAAYMQRTGRYEILFHESWAQPVASERAALPIIIDRSGDTDAWPELQGSVKLYLSRYLHLETDLWLNTRGDYLGDSDWQMPAPPRAPQSLIVETAPEELPSVTEPATPPAGELPATEDVLAELNEVSVEEEIDPRTVYPWRHAVALKQKRRMRSEEIHYIDHPMLGVVAYLTPLSPEEVEALSLQQAAEQQQPLAGAAIPQ